MKTKIISMAIAVAGLSAVLKADPPVPSEFDYEKINSTIKYAMDSVVASSAIISRFTYEIDPTQTDLANDRYGVKMEIVGKEPWSDENFSAEVNLTMTRAVSEHDEKLNLGYVLGVSTDTLALIRHHAQKSRVCDQQLTASGALRVALAEDCRILPRLSNVQSFDELFEIFRDHIDAAKIAMADYQAELKRASAVVTSDLAVASMKAQLEEVSQYLAAASEVRLTKTIDGVSLVIPDFPVHGILALKSIDVDFSPAKIRGSGILSVNFGAKIYEALKPEFLLLFRDLERNDGNAINLVQIETRFWLRLMEGHLTSPGN